MKIQGTKIRGLKLYSSAATVEPDSYFNLVSLLLPGNGTNGAQNNTFLDSSTNNFTVTRNGNTTQGTFSPFSQTGWSNYFNGSSQLVITSTSAAFDISGDFTVECWILGNDIDGQVLAIEQNTSPEYAAVQVQLSSNVYILNISQTGSSWAISQNTGVTNPNNSWNHIAVTRSGTSVKMFLNGTSIFSTTVSGALYSSGARSIINGRFGAAYFTGYVSNFRFVNGAALYTSNFTPPTEPLTTTSQGATAAQVELLTCQSNRFIDSSDNNFTITVSGTPQVLAVAPFNPTTAYAAGTVGGSGYFDGSGDYLTVPNNAAFDLASGNFTIECWAYPTTWNATAVGIFGKRSSTAVANQIGLEFAGSGGTIRFAYNSSGSEIGVNGAAGTLNAWQHIAVVRNGSTLTIYKDGVSTGTATINVSITTNAEALAIGVVSSNGSFPFTGYITNLRIVKGTALYTSAFTPPTAPPTAVTNTSLLLNYTNAGIPDATAKNVLETVGSAQISTAQSKFGGSSMYFDGNGDYLTIPNNVLFAFGTGDFTIECWVYSIAGSNNGVWQLASSAFPGTAGLAIFANGGMWTVYYGSTSQAFAIGSIGTGAWQHVALVRQSGSLYIYSNGVKYTVAASDTTNYTYTTLVIGGAYSTSFLWNGYINDLRITRGYARYTANFTPPTAAFPTQ